VILEFNQVVFIKRTLIQFISLKKINQAHSSKREPKDYMHPLKNTIQLYLLLFFLGNPRVPGSWGFMDTFQDTKSFSNSALMGSCQL
jgi:hypothetical protein